MRAKNAPGFLCPGRVLPKFRSCLLLLGLGSGGRLLRHLLRFAILFSQVLLAVMLRQVVKVNVVARGHVPGRARVDESGEREREKLA